MGSKIHVITVAAIFIACNLIMVSLAFNPNLAYGSYQENDINSTEVGTTPIYLDWHGNSIYYLTSTFNGVAQLGVVRDESNSIINDQISHAEGDSFVLGGISQDRVVIYPHQSAIFGPQTGNILNSIFHLYDLDGNFVETLNIHLLDVTAQVLDAAIRSPVIIDNYLFFIQVQVYGPNQEQYVLVRVNLENTTDVQATVLETSFVTAFGELAEVNSDLFVILRSSLDVEVLSIGDNLEQSLLHEYNLSPYISSWNSNNRLLMRDKNSLLFIDAEEYFLNTVIIITNLNSNTTFSQQVDYQISQTNWVITSNAVLLTGQFDNDASYYPGGKPLVLGFQYKGNSFNFTEIHTRLFDNDTEGIVYAPTTQGSKFAFSLYITNEDNLSTQIVYTDQVYSDGLFLDSVSPVVEFNGIALAMIGVYLTAIYIKSRKVREQPGDLEYPKI